MVLEGVLGKFPCEIFVWHFFLKSLKIELLMSF